MPKVIAGSAAQKVKGATRGRTRPTGARTKSHVQCY